MPKPLPRLRLSAKARPPRRELRPRLLPIRTSVRSFVPAPRLRMMPSVPHITPRVRPRQARTSMFTMRTLQRAPRRTDPLRPKKTGSSGLPILLRRAAARVRAARSSRRSCCLTRSSGKPQPMSAPTMPPAPAPASAAAIGPATQGGKREPRMRKSSLIESAVQEPIGRSSFGPAGRRFPEPSAAWTASRRIPPSRTAAVLRPATCPSTTQ